MNSKNKDSTTEALIMSFMICVLFTFILFPYLKPAIITLLSQGYAFTETRGYIEKPKVDEDVYFNDSKDLLYSNVEYVHNGKRYIFHINNHQNLAYYSFLLRKYYETSYPEDKISIPIYVCNFFPKIHSLYSVPPWPSDNPQYIIFLFVYFAFIICFIMSLIKMFINKRNNKYPYQKR